MWLIKDPWSKAEGRDTSSEYGEREKEKKKKKKLALQQELDPTQYKFPVKELFLAPMFPWDEKPTSLRKEHKLEHILSTETVLSYVTISVVLIWSHATGRHFTELNVSHRNVSRKGFLKFFCKRGYWPSSWRCNSSKLLQEPAGQKLLTLQNTACFTVSHGLQYKYSLLYKQHTNYWDWSTSTKPNPSAKT